MQPPFRRHREAAFLGDRDEIAKMAQLHASAHACEVWRPAYKVFFHHATSAQILDHLSDGKPSGRAGEMPPGHGFRSSKH